MRSVKESKGNTDALQKKIHKSTLQLARPEKNVGSTINLQVCPKPVVDLEITRKFQIDFSVDGGGHEKAYMHAGDADDVDLNDCDDERQDSLIRNKEVTVRNWTQPLQIRFDNNGVNTELDL